MVLLRTNMTLAGTIFCSTTFPLVGIAGTVCNYLLCAAIHNKKQLHTPANSLIFSLSIANMLVCSVTLSVATVSVFDSNHEGLIVAISETIVFCIMSSLLHLAIISFENYSYIFQQKKKRLTWRYITLIIPLVWITAFVYTLLISILRQLVAIWFAGCHFVWYLITTSIVIVYYLRILRKLHQHQRIFNSYRNYNQARRRFDTKTTQMILALAAIITISWLPAMCAFSAFIFSYNNVALADTFREPFNILCIFGYVGHATMPLVYAHYSLKYRTSMKDELFRLIHCNMRKSKIRITRVVPISSPTRTKFDIKG
ncbi:Trace amine-associated receptor 7e [Trichoplax sp. H2]|nr:Trace amine-associated receptor 7e [Trichoplax sp. H2]|eukprot:RDD46687.1 Trace amine-associated receptor 7e [Trichoplax sp. H2]